MGTEDGENKNWAALPSILFLELQISRVFLFVSALLDAWDETGTPKPVSATESTDSFKSATLEGRKDKVVCGWRLRWVHVLRSP